MHSGPLQAVTLWRLPFAVLAYQPCRLFNRTDYLTVPQPHFDQPHPA